MDMDPTSSRVRPAKDRNRSAITNGALLPGIDGRSGWVRRCRDLIGEHTTDLGGLDNISAAERSIVRRACVLTVELERLDEWTRGRFDHHGSWADFLMDPGRDTDAYGRDHDLAEAISRQDGDEFWSSVLGEDDSDRYLNPFLVGFVEGAMEVWGEVEPQL